MIYDDILSMVLSNKLSVFFRGALGINNKTLKFFSVLWKTQCMVHDALYKNCEIHCALVRGSGVKPVWLFSEIALNLNKYSSLLLYIFEEKNEVHGYDVRQALYRNFEIRDSLVRSLGPRAGLN